MGKISIVIATYNRREKLFECIKSILKNNYKNFEVIIVEQKGKGETRDILNKVKDNRVSYYNLPKQGGSRAKNFGIKKAKGEIVAFTDDDCLPAKNWLKEIFKSFQNKKEVTAIFGRTLPYQAENHTGFVCLCTFDKKRKRIITAPSRHWEKIGFGNNMAFRKEIFEKFGLFKEWLGPASLGLAAEDAEICYRLLIKGCKISYNPKILVYHSHWLKEGSNVWRERMRFYRCGELAAYGFYAFQGEKLGKEVIREDLGTLWNTYFRPKKVIKNLSQKFLHDAFLDIYYDLRGILTAFWFAKIDRILRKNLFPN